MSLTSTPASISSAAIRCAPASVFSYMNLPVSVTRPDVERRGDLRRQRDPEPLGDLETISRRARGLGVDEVHGPEPGVVVVMVDVQHRAPSRLQEVDRHAVDVSAVEEDEHAVDDVRGRLVEDVGQRQEPVLDRKRELLRGEEHHRVLAELARGCCCIASSEPSASPSGPSWVVSRNLSSARSASTPWSRSDANRGRPVAHSGSSTAARLGFAPLRLTVRATSRVGRRAPALRRR